MKTLHLFLLAAVVVLAVAVGCGETDQATAPLNDLSGPRGRIAATVPPTELVLALDVSDSTSQEELQGAIEGLLSCFGNPNIVPIDGTLSVAVVVYGDTTATPLETLTPLTSESLTNTIAPALNGLLSDRLVGTMGADLAGALDHTGMILASGMTMNRYVLLVGDGRADDGSDVAGSCQALIDANVWVNAIAMDDDEAGRTRLKECTTAAGGFFGEATTESFTMVCTDAFAYMLIVQFALTPESAEAPKDTEHTVSARIFRGLDDETPLEGLSVDFSIYGGPNAGKGATAMTDSLGEASFSWIGDGGAGVDSLTASVEHPSGAVTLMAEATMTWINQPPACDAGGPYEAMYMGMPVEIMLDGSASSDPDTNDVLSYMWEIDCEGASFDDATSMTPTLTIDLSCGCGEAIDIHLTVSDGSDSSECSTSVTLMDGEPPVIEPRPDALVLWPPNHKMVTVTPEMCLEAVSDGCSQIDLSDVYVLSVSSDEPVDQDGDGNTEPDIVIECSGDVHLRAERAGGGNGRVYMITYAVSDEAGHETELTCRVEVPHDQRGDAAIADEGMGHTVDTDCP